MARRNLHISSVAPSLRYPSATPSPGASDQENRDPATIQRRDKGKARQMDPPSRENLPTPDSADSHDASRGQKRKRTVGRDAGSVGPDASEDSETERFNRYFDPNQDAAQRREVKRASRALERRFNESRNDLLQNNDGDLAKLITEANQNFQHVKQTNDATMDSRLMVNISDLANKKAGQNSNGDRTTGIDVDDFLSKCIAFMRNGGPAEDAATQPVRRRAAQNRDDSDNEDDDDDSSAAMDWELLGRHACYPSNSRPPVPTFLLGPLSVQKKQRTQTQRRARQGRENAGREARPEALTREDIDQSNQNGLTEICRRIQRHLSKHFKDSGEKLGRAGITSHQELETDRGRKIMRELRTTITGGPNLFDYVINPHSFGQTVENLFYVSFLIKEGSCGIEPDQDGMPSLVIPENEPNGGQRRDTMKHQAIFSIDYGTWQDLVKAYKIEEPMIPHRDEELVPSTMGARGWYN